MLLSPNHLVWRTFIEFPSKSGIETTHENETTQTFTVDVYWFYLSNVSIDKTRDRGNMVSSSWQQQRAALNGYYRLINHERCYCCRALPRSAADKRHAPNRRRSGVSRRQTGLRYCNISSGSRPRFRYFSPMHGAE